MSTNKDLLVTTHLFKDIKSAEKAYEKAIENGYTPSDINIIMSESTRKQHYGSPLVKEESKASEGLGIGSITGAAIGGIVAAIAAIGTSLVVPGLGIIIAGPLAVGLAGAGAGGITGGLLGTLIGWGIPEEKAQIFETGIQSGGIVLGLNEKKPELENDWKQYS
ncbi:MAG: hypothetical protein H0U73_08555 [Tatlockia sp.]|nr:hypothetical protein [Tatlockia sp.]